MVTVTGDKGCTAVGRKELLPFQTVNWAAAELSLTEGCRGTPFSISLELPDLPDGNYRFRYRLVGANQQSDQVDTVAAVARKATLALGILPNTGTTVCEILGLEDLSGCALSDPAGSQKISFTLGDNTQTTIKATICEGDTYQLGNQSLTWEGRYVDIRRTPMGCEHVVTLDLSVVQEGDFFAAQDVDSVLAKRREIRVNVLANDWFLPQKMIRLEPPFPQYGDAMLTEEGDIIYQSTSTNFVGYDSVGYWLCPVGGCEKACSKSWLLVKGAPEMPNVITPNGDGLNDIFDPLKRLIEMGLVPPTANATLRILNRWGETVHLGKPYTPWDGLVNGNPVPQATYYYELRFGDSPPVRGAVAVLR